MNCGGYNDNTDRFRRMFTDSGKSSGEIDLVKCETHLSYVLAKGALTEINQDCFRWHFFWLLAYLTKLSRYREVFRLALNETILSNNI